jgi:hypothetical protein
VEIAEERSTLSVAFLSAVEIRVDRIGKFPRAAGGVERIGGPYSTGRNSG